MTSTPPTDVDDAERVPSEHSPTRLTKDDTFHLLQNSRRRAVLRYLLAYEDHEAFSMRDIAEAVAALEHDTMVKRLGSVERQRVYVSLYQSHLPKLDEHGVIDYDQSRGIVRSGPLLTVVEPYLADEFDADEGHLALEADQSEMSTRSGAIESFSTFLGR